MPSARRVESRRMNWMRYGDGPKNRRHHMSNEALGNQLAVFVEIEYCLLLVKVRFSREFAFRLLVIELLDLA